MRYKIPPVPGAIILIDDDGNSFFIHEGEPQWNDYLAWQAAGGQPETMGSVPVLSMDELRAGALMAINSAADAALFPITGSYPRAEIDSWPEQCGEARAWLIDVRASTPLLDAVLGHDLSDKATFCQGLLTKADAYKLAAGTVINWRRAVTAWVESVSDTDALLQWQPQFPEVPHATH